MKKTYVTPMAEKLEFDFTDTITASIGNTNMSETKCGNPCKDDHHFHWPHRP